MSMTTFILIVGLVLAAITEAIALLKWLYEQDQIQKIRREANHD